MNLPKILLTTYHEAFLHHGGGEYELKSMLYAIRRVGLIADIYGHDSKNIEEYDVIIHFSIHPGGLNLLNEIKKHGKSIILYPNLFIIDALPSAELINTFVNLSNFIVFTSHAMKNHFLKHFDIDMLKIKIIDSIFEPNINTSLSTQAFQGLFNLNEYALTYGIIDSNKNQLSVVHSLAKRNITLVLVGKFRNSEYYRACQRESQNVLFLDSLPYGSEIACSAFLGSQFYIELSESPAGISAIEAGLNGCKVILADTEWSREIFGDYAIYVNIDSPESIQNGIDRSLQLHYSSEEIKNHLKRFVTNEAINNLKNLFYECLKSCERIIPKVLLVQRRSMSHDSLISRSIGARFIPLLNYMQENNLILWEQISENDIQMSDIARFDILLFNKHTSNISIEILHKAKMLHKKVLYDLDDDLFNIPAYSVTKLENFELKNVSLFLNEANAITVSTPELKSVLQAQTVLETIILPNGFNHKKFPFDMEIIKKSEKNKILFSNTDQLKVIKFKNGFIKALNIFTANHPEITIDFWGDEFEGMEQINNLSYMGFLPNDLYKNRIQENNYLFAVIPLGGPEDAETYSFNKCKSNIKFIDYSSLGIVGIYSNNPVYSQIVKHESTGMIVENNVDEWTRAMESLYCNEALRNTIRTNAYEFSKANFSYERQAKIFSEIIYKL